MICLKGKIIWWQFTSIDHSSNMTNIILFKITLRVSLYIRQRNNLFFWQENQIVSEIFSSTEGGYMAEAACQDGNTIFTLILSGFISASFSFWNYSWNIQQGWIFCGVFKQKKKSMKWRSWGSTMRTCYGIFYPVTSPATSWRRIGIMK